MASRPFGAGTVIDGFELHEKLHAGGMAALWRVTHRDFDGPLVMKMPFIGWGDDPGAIVGFEVEQMILPRLSAARSALHRRRLLGSSLHRHGTHSGLIAESACRRPPPTA